MKLLTLSILGLLGFFLIVLLCFTLNRTTIENELSQQAHQILANHGLNQIMVTADGQIISLKGSVDNDEDRLQAESLIKTIDGITDVNNQLTLANVNPKSNADAIADTTIQTNTKKAAETSTTPLNYPTAPLPPVAPIMPEALTAPKPPVTSFTTPQQPIAPKQPMVPVPPIAPMPPIAPVPPMAPEPLIIPIPKTFVAPPSPVN